MIDIIRYCQMQAQDPDGQYHTDEKMLMHGNTVCRDISVNSRTVIESFYRNAVPFQSRYGLPEGFLRMEICGWQVGGGRYRPLSPTTFNVASWTTFNQTTGRPRAFAVFGRAAVERAVEVVHRIGVLPPAGEEHDTVQLQGGVVLDIKRGDRIVNVSDGSSTGYILRTQAILNDRNETVQVIGYSELQNGTRPFLQEDDKVRILSPGSPLFSLIISPTPSDAGEAGEEALFLAISRAHREISARDIQEENDFLELDIEFEPALREFILFYMFRDEHGADASATQAQYITANTAFRQALPNVQDRIRAWISMWYKRQGQLGTPQSFSRDPVALFPVGYGG